MRREPQRTSGRGVGGSWDAGGHTESARASARCRPAAEAPRRAACPSGRIGPQRQKQTNSAAGAGNMAANRPPRPRPRIREIT
ncbi:hypothetical protein C0216_00970 [Streptomyces globosus]|uniref:Uncharacterized protein n=1 Tax=Streptomyces globosus TaxID=68209 RepID=A0A344TU79_9ACTN|nr:hypothetical protein C0216_00970 [Streptomyces globosus]